MTARKKRLLEVAKLMDAGIPIDLIATKVNATTQTVNKDVAFILDGRLAEFDNKDFSDLIAGSFATYKRLKEEGWALYIRSHDNKERATALEKIKQAQQAEDTLLKMAGIYKEVRVDISIEQIQGSPQFQQMVNGLIDFLWSKKIDPAEYFEYMDRRAKGEENPIIFEKGEKELNPVAEKRVQQGDIYDKHRKERQYHREKGRKDMVMGRKVAHITDPRILGATDAHIEEAKRMLEEDAEQEDETAGQG